MRSIKEAFYWETKFEQEVGVKVYYVCDDSLNGNNLAAKMMRFTKYFAVGGAMKNGKGNLLVVTRKLHRRVLFI